MTEADVDLRARRFGGWGFENESYPAAEGFLAWLDDRLGPAERGFPSADLAAISPSPPRSLPSIQSISTGPQDRVLHSRGLGLPDLLRLRAGSPGALPDGVCRPRDPREIGDLLKLCSSADIKVIPRGGGTSVTGGVNPPPGDSPILILSLEHLTGMHEFDEMSGLATFSAGTTGPSLERLLSDRGFTLGHFPQSWELSTLGGWIATRASGQESLGYGSIHDLVAGLEVEAPAGRLVCKTFPSSAAGPDLREMILGSEGRLGVISRATVRVRRCPAIQQITGFLLPSWETGLDAVRQITRTGTSLTLLRLSDPEESEVAIQLGMGGRPWLRSGLDLYLKLRGLGGRPCLMLCGAAGDSDNVWAALDRADEEVRASAGSGLGLRPGRKWLHERYHHPYLRDSLLDHGYATDTLETAAPWSRLPELADKVRTALAQALHEVNERTATLCHVSHPYRDGASLYFTFFFRCSDDLDSTLSRWANLKRAATAAIVEGGGTLSHHHGVGSWHAPWWDLEVGATGRGILEATAAALDPKAILNPQALLNPSDRLED